MKLSRDLVAATAEPLILSLLRNGENYGYALIKQVLALSKGQLKWTEGMLYPVLHRLEKNGFVNSSWKGIESGRRRKYYRIQPKGLKRLDSHLQQWDLANSILLQSHGAANV